jgi:uncharacterized protein DUF4390
MNRRRWFWYVMAVFGASTSVISKESLRIIPIVNDSEVLVSFELADAYTAGVREAISSGLRTTFTYYLDLRMLAPFWMDRSIVTVVVSTTDQYDNLTRRHILTRTLDGHVEETLVTEDESIVGRWLTTFARLPLCRTSRLEPGREYYLRISARSRPHGDSLLGWANAITGQAKFTFVP